MISVIKGKTMLTNLESRPEVVGIDLDDTVFEREWITRFNGFLKGRVKRLSFPDYTIESLPDIDHTPIERPMSWNERISFNFHSKRRVIPGVAERLKALADNGTRIVALSGRHATIKWYEMTVDQLKHAGIPVTQIFLTPDGESTSVSKAHGILTAGVKEFYDDSLKTQYYLSGLFPEVIFGWIHHNLTDIPLTSKLLEARTNLKDIPLCKWMRR